MGEVLPFRGHIPEERWFFDQAHKLATQALASKQDFGGLTRPRLRYEFVVSDPATGNRYLISLTFTLEGYVRNSHRVLVETTSNLEDGDVLAEWFIQAAGTLPTVRMIAPAAHRWRLHAADLGFVFEWDRWEYSSSVDNIAGWSQLH